MFLTQLAKIPPKTLSILTKVKFKHTLTDGYFMTDQKLNMLYVMERINGFHGGCAC